MKTFVYLPNTNPAGIAPNDMAIAADAVDQLYITDDGQNNERPTDLRRVKAFSLVYGGKTYGFGDPSTDKFYDISDIVATLEANGLVFTGGWNYINVGNIAMIRPTNDQNGVPVIDWRPGYAESCYIAFKSGYEMLGSVNTDLIKHLILQNYKPVLDV